MKKVFITSFILAGLFITSKSIGQIFIKAVGSTGVGTTVGTFDGGSTDEGHRKQIEASAYSDGMAGCSNAGGGGGAAACKISKSPFQFSMPLSFAVNSFKYNMLVGKLLTSVDMEIVKNTGEGGSIEGLYKVHMEGVLVSSITEGASSGDLPIFNIELVPQKIAWQIAKQGNDGGIGEKFNIGWDFTKNKLFNYPFPGGSPSTATY